MKLIRLISHYVNELVDYYQGFQDSYAKNNNTKTQQAEIRLNRIVMSVKIDRIFEEELSTVGFDMRLVKCIIIKAQDSKKYRYCVRFKIKNCGLDEYDLFVQPLLDRGIRAYTCGKNLDSFYDGLQGRSWIAEKDQIMTLSINGTLQYLPFKKGAVIIPEIKRLALLEVKTAYIEINGSCRDAAIIEIANKELQCVQPPYVPLSVSYPKYRPEYTARVKKANTLDSRCSELVLIDAISIT